jgi:hypothetical protein
MIRWSMNKEFKMMWKKSGCGNFKVLSRNFPGRAKDNTKNFNQDIFGTDHDLKTGPSEYKQQC